MKTDIRILYEDNHLLVIVKPVNIPVQADSSNDSDVLSLMKAYLKEKYHKPNQAYLGLVQRLDRPVGGVMVLAKTSKAASRLSAALQTQHLCKSYLAVCCGRPDNSGSWTDYLVKDGATNTVSVSTPEKGKKAVLDYQLLACAKDLSLMKVDLHTGRSHQIRVQFASRGYPLWGDQRYNSQAVSGQQIALWSYRLDLVHPVSRQNMSFTALPPEVKPWLLFPLKELVTNEQ